MNIDGKIKGKFNVIDLLAIILVIAVAVGIVVRFKSTITTAVRSDEGFVYTVKVSGVKSYTVDALEKKGKVTDKKSGLDLGEITDVVAEPASTQTERADGKIVMSEQPERYNVTVTIKTRGKEAENSYITADSNELSVGRTTDIYTKYVHTSGKIMSVEKTEN
ncbi:MAG: DUF4330 domain-containing protein [Clostridia bacterium]|nr:DUF4330 domain-containing protein [Clostridia bacterium]